MMKRDNCANCTPGEPCRLHRVVADGTTVRVPLTMMDSMQREIADRGMDSMTSEMLDAKAKLNQAQLSEINRDAARRQAYADHFAEQRAGREREWQASASPSDRAYTEMVDGLSRRGC